MTSWYLNRLRTFSPAEFSYRIRQQIKKRYEKLFSAGQINKQRRCSYFTINGFNADIDEIYSLSIKIFGKDFNYETPEIDWHKDIFSGNSFPVSFSKDINIRSIADLSAKNVWEVNRLQFLPHLALNYRKTGEKKYLNLFVEIITSWDDNNPYLKGVNWFSNIEVNIRLINWFLSWQILEADKLAESDTLFDEFIKSRWLPLIYQHCKYSYQNPSKFSSSNNHLISEYSGLYIASSIWKFDESDSWMEYARKGLEAEIQRQHSSGINREEAAEYIQFITDFFLLPLVIGEKTGKPFSKYYYKTLLQIFQYIYVFLDSKGNFPKYGDEDDGKCFIFDLNDDFNNFKSLLTSAAILFKEEKFKAKSNSFDLKNQILFGNEGRITFDSLPIKTFSVESCFYKDEGHFIFRFNENEKETYLHFDAAPLGFLSIAAHGHADALSFLMHINGQPVFIDSGTYTYHTEPEWRKYFIGTLAHNTVRINHHDQALNGGPTLWLDHYQPEILDIVQDRKIESVKASHNGYKKEGVQHIREIIFDRDNLEFIIIDTIVMNKKGIVHVEIPFHLHPQIKPIEEIPNKFILNINTTDHIEFTVDKGLKHELLNGLKSPQIIGWYSESFLKKTNTNVIYCSSSISKTTSFKFVIKINQYGN